MFKVFMKLVNKYGLSTAQKIAQHDMRLPSGTINSFSIMAKENAARTLRQAPSRYMPKSKLTFKQRKKARVKAAQRAQMLAGGGKPYMSSYRQQLQLAMKDAGKRQSALSRDIAQTRQTDLSPLKTPVGSESYTYPQKVNRMYNYRSGINLPLTDREKRARYRRMLKILESMENF